MKNIEIHPTIGFSKKGDDFHHCLKQTSIFLSKLKETHTGFGFLALKMLPIS